jgi:hypothetical protein
VFVSQRALSPGFLAKTQSEEARDARLAELEVEKARLRALLAGQPKCGQSRETT